MSGGDPVQALDLSVDLLQALLWQDNNAASTQALLQAKQDWYDTNQTAFWTDWTRDVFDLRRANVFGCAVWSKILGQPLVANVAASGPGYPAWGFGACHRNFGHGNFATGQSSALSLSVEQQRILLMLRYRQLTTNGTVPNINAILNDLFAASAPVSVIDGLDMTGVFVFTTPPPAPVLNVLTLFDLLPRPAGVGTTLYSLPTGNFGFGIYHRNFHHSNFAVLS